MGSDKLVRLISSRLNSLKAVLYATRSSTGRLRHTSRSKSLSRQPQLLQPLTRLASSIGISSRRISSCELMVSSSYLISASQNEQNHCSGHTRSPHPANPTLYPDWSWARRGICHLS